MGGFGLFIVYLATALPVAYPEDDLDTVVSLFSDPLGRVLTGPGYGFDAPTYERLVANGYGLYLMILSGLMSVLLVVRHTRVEEQTGRAELVRANVVGRHAPLTAAVAAVGLAFARVAAVTVQLSQYSRAAAGMAGGAMGLAFVLRSGGDMA